MYKWDAKEYHKNSKNQKRWAEGLLAQIPLKGNESVLDVGCGNGRVTAMIAKKLPRGRVLGIDSSREMVAFATAFYKKQSKRLKFEKRNACRLGLRDEFDIVFSNSCFHWISDHRSLLKSIYSALKPGGRLCVRTGAARSFGRVIDVGDLLCRGKKWGRYFRGFKSPFYFAELVPFRALLKSCGFKVRTIRTFIGYMKYNNSADLKASLRPIWAAYSSQVPKRRREEYLEELVSRYLEACPPDRHGRINVRMRRLEFQAEKPRTVPGTFRRG